jgi:predicted glycogen debranching enzyme
MGEYLEQFPRPGEYLIFREGDFITIELRVPEGLEGKAFLRTNLFDPVIKRQESIAKTEQDIPRRFQEWGDLRMRQKNRQVYDIELPLDYIGFFEAKAYFLRDDEPDPLWPEGENLFIKTEPADSVISNSIYNAFVRLFIDEQSLLSFKEDLTALDGLKNKQFSVIPDTGKFRDLVKEIDFIVEDLGFDIIMLLPVHPVPTTYARMGLLGSPYAALDFMNVDPAMAEFDKETTPLEQFAELVDAIHARHARIFMDIPVNHTGWASQLQIHHPEFFVKNEEGKFVSPGAWGVTWSDLSELDYSNKELWQYMAEVFLFWCRRGVDGFRCDAGYMIPSDAWEYITAKVRSQFPATIFLLEGLGGKVSTTEKLLTHCNLNWAYSEMFQNYDQDQMEWYIEEFKRISLTKGPLINFSETHDNNRLASVSKGFSRLRNGLTALFSDRGTFAITCGVEWFADEKIDVHRLTSLNRGNSDNQIDFIKRLNNILKSHPTFQSSFDLTPIHTSHCNSIAYVRHSDNSIEKLVVIANLSPDDNEIYLEKISFDAFIENNQDLLTGEDVVAEEKKGEYRISMRPYQIAVLANHSRYFHWVTDRRINRIVTDTKAERLLKIQIMRLFSAYQDMSERLIGVKTAEFKASPYAFFFDNFQKRPPVIRWVFPGDVNRQVVVPENTPVLIVAPRFFRYTLKYEREILGHGEGFFLEKSKYVAIISPATFKKTGTDLQLKTELYDGSSVIKKTGNLIIASQNNYHFIKNHYGHEDLIKNNKLKALSVNRLSGISVSGGAFGNLQSKYDALISANLNLNMPEDRHIMFTRLRGWSVYKGFSRAFIPEYQKSFFHEGNTSRYYFEVPAGGGMLIPLSITLLFDKDDNFLNVQIRRYEKSDVPVPPREVPVKIILRPDIESRNHHELTKAFMGPEENWPGNIAKQSNGFTFEESDNVLEISCSKGFFVREDEWYYRISHPTEKERGMDWEGDLYSPGYFQLDLKSEQQSDLNAFVYLRGGKGSIFHNEELAAEFDPPLSPGFDLKESLQNSIEKFIVRRNSNQTVIAGYPWFLDWSRDTLICLRGIISAGFMNEARKIIREFASFEDSGTLPNLIRGGDTSNRDTSDAPLWLFVAVKDVIHYQDDNFLQKYCGERKLIEVLQSIAKNYIKGTSNGIKMDEESGLVYSPTHFTWMDTNHPAGTPREGYPIEIQALWYHALHFLAQFDPGDNQWEALSDKIKQSIIDYFLIENHDDSNIFEKELFLVDCLHTKGFFPASQAVPDDHLRPNQLITITLGAVEDKNICRGILSACEELIVPGAIRTLADRHTSYQLPVYHKGQLLNNPSHPYKGEYKGDEDYSRKPAYHNGTAWTWPFPSYCEALYNIFGENALNEAANILSTSMKLMNEGCVAQLPEIIDGNFPHSHRGCFAQAWGITEFYRVALMLGMLE